MKSLFSKLKNPTEIYSLCAPSETTILDKNKFVYVDTETADKYKDIVLVQIFQSHFDKVLVIVIQNKEQLRTIYEVLKDCKVVFNNGHYDMSCFINDLGPDARFNEWYDTFLAARLHPKYIDLESYSLDNLLERCLNFDAYAYCGIDKSSMQKAKWDKLFTLGESERELMYLYASLDVYLLPYLMRDVYDILETQIYKLDISTVTNMLTFQQKGLPVSPSKLNRAKWETTERVHELKSHLPADLNVNSPKQVKAYLNSESSDDETLASLISEGVVEASYIRELKSCNKKLSFISKFESDDNRIYGYFNVIPRSGRSNCSDQNLQQLPSSLKHVFQAREGKYLVYADFSNLELRTFAAVVGEPVMRKLFIDDVDLHTYTSEQIFPNLIELELLKPEHLRNNTLLNLTDKEKRQISKIFNFSSLYGAGVATRLTILLKSTGLALDEETGSKIAKRWLETYPGVKSWHQENSIKYRNGQPGITALGRVYKAKMFTDQNNIQIQGSAAEVAKLTLHKLKDTSVDLRNLCAFIHDSYTFECDSLLDAKNYANILAYTMHEAWETMCKLFAATKDSYGKIRGFGDIPMPVEAVVAENWKDCQENENLLYGISLKPTYDYQNKKFILEEKII